MAKVVDIADEIWRESDQDSSHSIPSIAAWLRFGGNLGTLNNLLHTDYSVNSSDLEIYNSSNVIIGDNEVAIYKALYFIKFYDRMVKNSLGAASVDLLTEASSDGGTLRWVNRNEKAKTFAQLKKDYQTELDKLINWYKRNAYAPQSIDGADTIVCNVPPNYNTRTQNW